MQFWAKLHWLWGVKLAGWGMATCFYSAALSPNCPVAKSLTHELTVTGPGQLHLFRKMKDSIAGMQNEIKTSLGDSNTKTGRRLCHLCEMSSAPEFENEIIMYWRILSNIEKRDWNEVQVPEWFASLWSEMLVAISLKNSTVKLRCIGLSFPVTRLPNMGVAPSFTLAYYFWRSFHSAA